MTNSFGTLLPPTKTWTVSDEVDVIDHDGDFTVEFTFTSTDNDNPTFTAGAGASFELDVGVQYNFWLRRIDGVFRSAGGSAEPEGCWSKGPLVYFGEFSDVIFERIRYWDSTDIIAELTPAQFYPNHLKFHIPGIQELHVLSPETKLELESLVNEQNDFSKNLIGSEKIKSKLGEMVSGAPDLVGNPGTDIVDKLNVHVGEVAVNLFDWLLFNRFPRNPIAKLQPTGQQWGIDIYDSENMVYKGFSMSVEVSSEVGYVVQSLPTNYGIFAPPITVPTIGVQWDLTDFRKARI